MKVLNLLLSSLVFSFAINAFATADVYKNVSITVNGKQTLALRSVLGITSQAGYSGMFVGRIVMCGASAAGKGSATLIENLNNPGPSVTIAATPGCYEFAVPQPGRLDYEINYLQMKLEGNFKITALGAYQN